MANIVDLVAGFGTFASSSTQNFELGQVGRDNNGNLYRYCLAGASDLVAGNLIQAPAQIANHLALTPTLPTGGGGTIGDLQVVATLGATAAAQNLYAEGWVTASTTPGLGYSYKIKGHASVLSSGVITANLSIDTPIQVALTSSSRVDFQQNAYANVIATPTSLTNVPVGVAPAIIKATQYGWIQTHGPCPTLINGTPAVGQGVIPSATTSGAVDIASSTGPVVGWMMVTGVSTKSQFVFMNID